MHKVVDNFLQQDQFNKLKDHLESQHFPWFRAKGIDHRSDGKIQFVHTWYDYQTFEWNSNPEIILPLIDVIKPASIGRIKANMTIPSPEVVENQLHKDVAEPEYLTAVYYLTTCDGYTKLETGEKIESVANRIVFFPSQILHTGTSCTDWRIVLNLNFIQRVDHKWI